MSHSAPLHKSRAWSRWALLCYTAIALWTFHAKRFYAQPPSQLIHYDAMGYYAYLCLWWSDATPEFERLRALPHNTFVIPYPTASGGQVDLNKYSTGLALLHTPFFWIGDIQANLEGLPRDGIGRPYRYWTALGAVFYAFLALLLLRAWLLHFCEEGATAMALLGIGLGTHWWHYTLYAPFMAHNTAFFGMAALLYGSQRWYTTGAWRWALLVAGATGLLAATRLPDLIVGWVVLLGGVGSWAAWRERWRFLLEHWAQLLVGLVVVLALQVPQMLYWKQSTGYYWVNAYQANGEGFFWGQPRLAEILIGYRKGWLIYTPMAVLCLLGLGALYRQQRDWWLAISGYVFLQLYLVAAWGCWWFGGGFGLRPMVESMAVLSLPLALLWQGAQRRGGWRPWLLGLAMVWLTVLNQFQSHQYQYGLIHWDGMSRAAYWHAFGKIPPVSETFHAEQAPLLIPPDPLLESQRKKNATTIW